MVLAGASPSCLCSLQPAPGSPTPLQRLPMASPSNPAGMGLIPRSFPPPALQVSACPSHGFGAAKCIGEACGHAVQAALSSLTAPSQPAPAGRLDRLPGSPGRGRQVWVDQTSILELFHVLRQGARPAGAPRQSPVPCADPGCPGFPCLSPQEPLALHPHRLPQDWLQGQ